ncbi:hypothetical protein [Methylobacterium brachiatum]|uniref:hypothetical protein n=1 Tax=Methylobacterium brachiatum TaxID=269660 RepID=UPI00142891D6|nr:hypothetical protein [Methylobacterium brachiatum]
MTVLRTRGGVLDSQDQEAFDALSDRLVRGRPPVLIHLHGGLVDQAAAEVVAERLSKTGPEAYNAPESWEQVYVVWRTGAFETLRQNWTDLARNDRLYRVLIKRLISFVSGRIESIDPEGRGRGSPRRLTPAEVEARLYGGSDAPFADVDQATSSLAAGARSVEIEPYADDDLELELRADSELDEVASDIEAGLRAASTDTARTASVGDAAVGAASLRRLDGRVRAELSTAPQGAARSFTAAEIGRRLVKHGVSIGRRVLGRYRNGRDHGLHATVAEEIARELYGDLIGSVVWGMMKGDAREHFAAGGFGAEFAQALAAAPGTRVMIVAHSAGAILASEFLIHLAEREISLSVDLVFLAAAVRTPKFAEALKLSESRIASFRAFLMRDDLERADVLLGKGFGFVYPSSLLYLVSGLFEEKGPDGLADAPLVGMERFLDASSSWLADAGEGAALGAVQRFLSDGRGRCVLSRSEGEQGLACVAVSHGDFDNETLTLASIVHFLKEPRP